MGCPFNIDCIKSKKEYDRPSKTIKFSLDFELSRQESKENPRTKEGINHSINRLIQVEGFFSKLKDGIIYRFI